MSDKGSSRRRRGHGGGGGGGGGHDGGGGLRWLLTYADMITLLLALFIYFYSISTVSESKAQEFGIEFANQFGIMKGNKNPLEGGKGIFPYNESIVERRKVEGKKIPKRLEQLGAVVKAEEQGMIITLSDHLLFAPGSAKLLPGTDDILDNVAFFIKEIAADAPVRIEGHTDNSDVSRSPLYPSNWELSAGRSAAIARILVDKFKVPAQRLKVIGYGPHRPLAGTLEQQSPEEQAKNRRVEIIVEY